AVFEDSVIKHTHVLAVGGQLVTRDIAIGLNIPIEHAEELKIKHGLAHRNLIQEDIAIPLPSFGSRPESEIALSQLTQIIQFRMQEIFEFVRDEIMKMMGAHYQQKLPAGMIITGGGSLIRGTDQIAADVFGFPVQVRGPRGIGGLTKNVESPIFATGVGLVLYGAKYSENSDVFRGDDSRIFEKIFDRMKSWVTDFFS
ncbi:MAG: rod shape-determining protein, partial [FCB group bacterium]|nr:rod shape-determining protein [FCB group bacterium]